MAQVSHTQRKAKGRVGVGDLRVIVTNEDGFWFAQGLEVDYATEGSSLEDVQQRFENGLKATIREHLKLHGDIKRLTKPAPPEVWAEFFSSTTADRLIHSQISLYVLPKPKRKAKASGRSSAVDPFPFDQIRFVNLSPVPPRADRAVA